MTIDTTYLDSGADKIKLARPAILAMAQEINLIEGSGGAEKVGFLPSGTGAVASDAQRKLREIVSIIDFGAVGNGVTDDTVATQKALDSLGTDGGTVIIPNGFVPLIDGNLNIPDNCALAGQKAIRGRTFSSPNMNLWKPRIILNRSATITLNNSSEISKIGIFAKSLTFSDTSANVATWSGIAVTLANNKADQLVEDCMIIGFGTAISTGSNTRVDRPRINRCFIDCVNGIYLKNCYDVPYISDIHGWPWATLESTPETNNAHLKRSGSFIQLDGALNDWAKIRDCFNYGWKNGYRISGADSVTLIGCSADNPPGTADASIGFLIEGGAIDTKIIGCQAAGRQTGIYVQTTDANGRVFISDTNVWASFDNAIRISNGDVNISDCGIRNTGAVGNGVYFENSGTKARVMGCKINGFSIGIKTDSTGAVVLHDNCDFDGTTTPINNAFLRGIASANPLNLDGISTFFKIAGTTNFNVINDPKQYVGRTVSLKFDSSLFVSTGGNIKPAGGAAFSASTDDTITFASDGVTWYEVARSIN